MATPHSPALHPSAALDRWRRIEALLHAWLEQRRRLDRVRRQEQLFPSPAQE